MPIYMPLGANKIVIKVSVAYTRKQMGKGQEHNFAPIYMYISTYMYHGKTTFSLVASMYGPFHKLPW